VAATYSQCYSQHPCPRLQRTQHLAAAAAGKLLPTVLLMLLGVVVVVVGPMMLMLVLVVRLVATELAVVHLCLMHTRKGCCSRG
jgi:hypothetical protein